MKDGVFPAYLLVETLNVRTGPSISAMKMGEIKGVGSKVEVLVQDNTGKGKLSSPCNAKGEYVEDPKGEVWIMLPNYGESGGWVAMVYGGKQYLSGEPPAAKKPAPKVASSTTKVKSPASVTVASQTKAAGITPVQVGIVLLAIAIYYSMSGPKARTA